MIIKLFGLILLVSGCGLDAAVGPRYNSAGVVPIERFAKGGPYACNLFRTDRKPTHTNIEHHLKATYEFADLGARRNPGENDPAITAARALFSHQARFTDLMQLARYIAKSAKVDMQGHITYFVPFQTDELRLPPSVWPVMLDDLIGLTTLPAAPDKYFVHDPTGCFIRLNQKFAEGLKKGANLTILKNIR